MRAKSYNDVEKFAGPWTGEREFTEIVEAIERRNGQRAPPAIGESGVENGGVQQESKAALFEAALGLAIADAAATAVAG